MSDDKKEYAEGEKVAVDNSPVYEAGEAGVGTIKRDFVNNEDYYALSFWGRMGFTPASFKRRPANADNSHNQLNQTMKGRHLHMIAIGGSIGAGLFVGTGSALRRGGPASLLIDYAIIGVMMFNVVFALGEMALMYPVSGGFYTLVTRFVDPSWGFAVSVSPAIIEFQCIPRTLANQRLCATCADGVELLPAMGLHPAVRNRCRSIHHQLLVRRQR